MTHPIWSLPWILVAVFAACPTLAQSPKLEALAELWKDLVDPDAEKAFRAMRQLAQTPKETVAFFREAIHPASAVKGELIDELIRKLGSERFQEREHARKELERHDWQALGALRKAAQGTLDLETKRRVDQLMARLAGPLSGMPLRMHRAVEVVEWIGSDEARGLIERWSQGTADARLTQEARKALKRWGWRPEYWPGSRPWAPGAEPTGPARPLVTTHKKTRLDAAGDPLSAGAILRLGTTRWQTGGPQGSIQYTLDGTRLVVASAGAVVMADAQNGKVLFREDFEGYATKAMLSPDGRRLVATGDFHAKQAFSLRVWDLEDFKNTLTWDVKGGILGFTQNGHVLLETEKGIQEYDVKARREIGFHPFPLGAGPLTAFNGKNAVARDHKGKRLFVYDWSKPGATRNVKIPEKLAGSESPNMALSPDAKTLAWGKNDLGVLLFDVTTGQLIRHLAPLSHSDPVIRALAFSPDGKTLAFTDGVEKQQLVVWDMEKHKLRWKTETDISGLAFSPDSRCIAGASDVRIHIWDALTGKERNSEKDVSFSATEELEFSADGRRLWNMTADALYVWDFPSGALRRTFPHAQGQNAAVSPDGRRVATASHVGKIRIWDMATARKLVDLPGPPPYMNGLRFSSDGQRLFTWGEDLILRDWNVENGRLRAEHLPAPRGSPRWMRKASDLCRTGSD